MKGLLICGGLIAAAMLWLPRDVPTHQIAALPFASPPPQQVELLFVGTSLSDGYDWPEGVAAELARCLDRPVSLQRITRGGATSLWGQAQLHHHVQTAPAATARPQVIVLEFTVNDADLRNSISPRQAAALTQDMLADLARFAPDARVLLLGMYPGRGPRGWLRLRHKRYVTQYRQLATATPQIGFLDLAPHWRQALQDPAQVTPPLTDPLPDGLHPTPEAARQINIAPVAQSLLDLWPASSDQPECLISHSP